MEEDKINIPEVIRVMLDTKTYQTLKNDMDLFEIEKTSTFVNRIIVNLYPNYEQSSFTFNRIKDIVRKKANISEDLAKEITEDFYKEIQIKSHTKFIFNKAISIRPNADSKKIFTLHSSVLNGLNNFSVGTTVKNMILEYTKLSRVERESIVFRKEMSEIEGSIRTKSKLLLEYNKNSVIFHPSAIIEIVDDYGNFLLGYNEKTKKEEIILLRKITKVYPTGENFIPSKKIKKITESYRNKIIPFLSEKEMTVLKIFFNKDNLESLLIFLNEYEKNNNIKFDRSLSDKTINSFLPTLFTVESNVGDTDIKIEIKSR